MKENAAFERWCTNATDERHQMNGKAVPILTVVLYKVCGNNADKFNEALIALQAAFEGGAQAARMNED